MPRGFYRGMLVAAIATLTALATVFAAGRSDLQERFSVSHSSGTIRFTFEIEDGMSHARLEVDAVVKSGEISWTFQDPDGHVVLRGRGRRGRVSTDTGRVESRPGTWVLTVELRDATGRYGYDWQAR